MSQSLDNFRTWISLLTLLFVVLTTGLYVNFPWLIAANAGISICLATLWLVPSDVMGDRLGRNGVILALLAITLAALQMLPLPASVWQVLPGRDFEIRALGAVGHQNSALPFTLSPYGTSVALLTMISGFGFFCVGLAFPKKKRHYLAAAIVLAALVNIFFGLFVKSAAPASETFLGQFYDAGNVSGLFFNRNFMAALLYASIPMLAAFLLYFVAKSRISAFATLVFGFIYLLLILLGLGATGSRTGIILSMLALLASPILVRGAVPKKAKSSRAVIVTVVIAFVVLGLAGQASVSRIARLDPVNEQRLTIYSLTLRAITHYFPAGSGLGSFVPVYQQIEQPADMVGSAYVNHAHNDWLELALEGGAPMIILMLAGLAWLAAAQYRVWTTVGDLSENLAPKAASLVVILLLLHSLVDFPLRTFADAAVFALSLGLMAARPALPKLRRAHRSEQFERAPQPHVHAGPLWPQPRPTASEQELH